MTHVQKTVGAYTCNKVIEFNFSWRTSDRHLFGVKKKPLVNQGTKQKVYETVYVPSKITPDCYKVQRDEAQTN
jgi:hypothetical protein